MNITLSEQKVPIRTKKLAERALIPRRLKEIADQNICKDLIAMIIERKVTVIHTYLPMKSEINVIPVIEWALGQGVTVVVSKTLRKRQMENLVLTDLKNMEPGIFGTYHPKEAKVYTGKYDLIIVAGLAFSEDLYRVGYGGGYYDTFLVDQEDAHKVGVAYASQMVDSVPVEAHDIQLDEIISY